MGRHRRALTAARFRRARSSRKNLTTLTIFSGSRLREPFLFLADLKRLMEFSRPVQVGTKVAGAWFGLDASGQERRRGAALHNQSAARQAARTRFSSELISVWCNFSIRRFERTTASESVARNSSASISARARRSSLCDMWKKDA